MSEVVLKKPRPYGPDVVLKELNGIQVVEKSYTRRKWSVRLLGRLLVGWESLIYSRLQGVKGIPALHPAKDRCTLVTSYMGGENLRETAITPGREYFDELEELIEAMHRRGVVHLDLRNRRNYGIDADGQPYLIDFATSFYMPLRGPLMKLLTQIDWMGYMKVKSKLNPAILTADEQARAEKGRRLSDLWLPGRLKSKLRNK